MDATNSWGKRAAVLMGLDMLAARTPSGVLIQSSDEEFCVVAEPGRLGRRAPARGATNVAVQDVAVNRLVLHGSRNPQAAANQHNRDWGILGDAEEHRTREAGHE